MRTFAEILAKVESLKNKPKLPGYTVAKSEDPKQYNREAQARYKARNRDVINARHRAYYSAHREECIERVKRCRANRKAKEAQNEG